jgi:hypothetical protein
VFWPTPPQILESAVPLYAELAAERMRLALVKLVLKYSPDQPRVPAGNSDGGQWTGAGGNRLAGGMEDDENNRAGRSSIIENSPADFRREDFGDSVLILRRLEPGNPNLKYVTDGSAPGQ